MALPVGNPILRLWQETVANGGTLDDALERVGVRCTPKSGQWLGA